MKDRLTKISTVFSKFIEDIEPLLYPGRCAAIAQTKLEEAHMWLMNMKNDTTIKEVAKIREQANSRILVPTPAVAPELKRELQLNLFNNEKEK